MTDEEKLYHILDRSYKMIKARQQQHEQTAKKYSGPSNKRTNGIRAKECASILHEMKKILKEYEES